MIKSQKSVNFSEKNADPEKANSMGDEAFFNQAVDNAIENPPIKRRKTDYSTSMVAKNQTVLKKKKRLNEIVIEGNSLFCIGENNRLRIYVGKFCENPYFESFIFNLIGVNSLFLAI